MILLVSIAAVAASTAAPAPAQAPVTDPPLRELTIAFMSNRHGQVAPCHCDTAPLGGVDRQVGALQRLRAEKKALLVLDGGDNFFDSANNAMAKDALERAELIADAFAQLKPDAVTPGERDFVRGGPLVRELGIRGRMPWLMTNIAPPSDKAPMVKPFLMQKFADGQRVLVLGVYSKSAFPKQLQDEKYTFTDPLEAINRMLAMYRSYADLIVVIVHGDAQTEEKIATKAEGVSLVFNGHDGRLQFGARTFGTVQSLAAGNSGKYLLHVDLRYKGSLPKLEAGMDVQKYFREQKQQGGKMDSGLGLKNTLFFQLLPLAADVPTVPELQARAKAIDPIGYEIAASQPR